MNTTFETDLQTENYPQRVSATTPDRRPTNRELIKNTKFRKKNGKRTTRQGQESMIFVKKTEKELQGRAKNQ